MNFFRRIVAAVRMVFNRYEAAYQKWGERSWLGQGYQGARQDIDKMTRQELQRKHRFWVCNSSLVNRIRNLYIQFSSGVSGLITVPNSDDEDWNHTRQASWQQWGRTCDLSSTLTFQQNTILWAGQLFDDGEIFIIKTKDARNRPAIQTIESHRVFTPTTERQREGKTVVDGIEIDANGKPTGYWVSAETENPTSPNPQSELIPSERVIHAFRHRRPGQMRGIPEGFACMNVLHDYEDLHLMEMQVAKLASSIGNVESNPTGEIDTAATRRVRMTMATQNQAGQTVTKSADNYYRVTVGAQTIALKNGDSIKQFQVDRPSIATQNYWDLKLSEICCGYNVPKLLVVPYSLQGTVTRADLDICANAFRLYFEILKDVITQLYEWQSEWAIRFDRGLDGVAPLNYNLCEIQPPRAPNVDIGYTAAALQLELQMGTKSYQDVCAERQIDWRRHMRQNAEAAAYKNKLAKKFEVDPKEISDFGNLPDAPPEPDADDVPITHQTAQTADAAT
jgi:capsid protein